MFIQKSESPEIVLIIINLDGSNMKYIPPVSAKYFFFEPHTLSVMIPQ
jgi:hypothetical protein